MNNDWHIVIDRLRDDDHKEVVESPLAFLHLYRA